MSTPIGLNGASVTKHVVEDPKAAHERLPDRHGMEALNVQKKIQKRKELVMKPLAQVVYNI